MFYLKAEPYEKFKFNSRRVTNMLKLHIDIIFFDIILFKVLCFDDAVLGDWSVTAISDVKSFPSTASCNCCVYLLWLVN